jgi:hypothetical protein
VSGLTATNRHNPMALFADQIVAKAGQEVVKSDTLIVERIRYALCDCAGSRQLLECRALSRAHADVSEGDCDHG